MNSNRETDLRLTGRAVWIAVALTLLLPLTVHTEPSVIEGRVVSIADGDTLTLLTSDKKQVKVRLAEIDTPERGQPYASKAKDELSALVWQKEISVRVIDVDRYGRSVGRIYVDGIDVSAEMVRRGAAWVYRKYATDDNLHELENEARESKRGLWSLPESERLPPWEWRRGSNKAEERPDGCNIKGNINSKGDRIYHSPGRSSYGATKINESKGERWFCSESEARSAGWRAPRN